jgi:hypothetical protein
MGRLARTVPLTSAVMAWLAITGCESSSSTQLVTPTTSKCQLSATSSLSNVPAAGGAGTVAIDTTRDCTWSASTTASWIALGSSTSGQGSGTLDFRVGANPTPTARQSVLSVNDTGLLITQAAAPCTFALSPSSPTVGSAGGAVTVQITTISGCTWTTSSSTPWLAVTGGSTSSGQATITAEANAGAARSGTVTIAGQSVTVSQAAASMCGFTLSPTSQTVPSVGGAVTVQVTTTEGCGWTTSSGTPWLTVTGGGNASGPATVTAAANVGPARTGTVTIAGQTVSVSQAAAAACAFTIAPTSQTVPAAGGSIPVAVTAGSTCSWTSVSNVPWVTVAAGASGTGNGAVTLTIAANTAGQRDGTVTIAGQTFTVSQAAACNFSISPTTQSVPAQGGSILVQVTAPSGCTWTATSDAMWITVSGGGDGNGTVTIAVAANTVNARSGTATIAGQTFTVNQATGCTFSLAPNGQAFGSDPNIGMVTLTTQAGCVWTATSSDPDWLSITSGASGTGNGLVTFAVAANTKHKDRTGRLTIADQTFDVTQSGNH